MLPARKRKLAKFNPKTLRSFRNIHNHITYRQGLKKVQSDLTKKASPKVFMTALIDPKANKMNKVNHVNQVNQMVNMEASQPTSLSPIPGEVASTPKIPKIRLNKNLSASIMPRLSVVNRFGKFKNGG